MILLSWMNIGEVIIWSVKWLFWSFNRPLNSSHNNIFLIWVSGFVLAQLYLFVLQLLECGCNVKGVEDGSFTCDINGNCGKCSKGYKSGSPRKCNTCASGYYVSDGINGINPTCKGEYSSLKILWIFLFYKISQTKTFSEVSLRAAWVVWIFEIFIYF